MERERRPWEGLQFARSTVGTPTLAWLLAKNGLLFMTPAFVFLRNLCEQRRKRKRDKRETQVARKEVPNQTQGQFVGAEKSLNGRERKVKRAKNSCPVFFSRPSGAVSGDGEKVSEDEFNQP